MIITELLVDGHVSRFDLGFLKYICDEDYKYTIVFGVTMGHYCGRWETQHNRIKHTKFILLKQSMIYLHIGLKI